MSVLRRVTALLLPATTKKLHNKKPDGESRQVFLCLDFRMLLLTSTRRETMFEVFPLERRQNETSVLTGSAVPDFGQCFTARQQVVVHQLLGLDGIARLQRCHDQAVLVQ